MIDTQEHINALEDEGFEVKAYSGRAMFGAECVSIRIESDSELWDLGVAIGRADLDVRAPRIDTLGRGLVAYWPAAKWPEEA